ncbi:transcriptional regulator, IclR family [Saccharopolyspora kobensis]|uniref:Transcriptional regulator, IclR family n=1 Tax=Saccharopolyspora kobensis TaxID=146035 RepID=A0A1H5TEA4_9PSEU|nr:transcriptional regulator, IclR family [Saccharopolyspora kobensis]SFC47726.1 transcriptional regulator, IclR family [Saccharopolyspora kobensis]
MGSAVPPAGAAKAHRTVSRVTTILELAAAHRSGVRLAELAAALDAPRSSVHGLVKGLVVTGYLREEGGAYRIGPAINSLLAAAPPTVAEAARPAMERLHRQFDETVMLATLVGDSVVYTDAIESTEPIRYSAPLRTRRPLHPTSSGKCILAFGTERFREGYLAGHLSDPDQREQIRRQLEEVAEAGVAINRGETLPDRSGVGAPIFEKGKVAAAIAVAGPSSRLADKITEIAEATKAAAHEVSEHLAGRV